MSHPPPIPVEVRPIPGFPGYRATSEGHILSKASGKPLKPRRDRNGYLRLRLYGDHLPARIVRVGERVHQVRFVDVYVHVLVCTAWHGARPHHDAQVLHWDDQRDHNVPENLRWGTREENLADRVRNTADPCDEGGFDWRRGEAIGRTTLSKNTFEAHMHALALRMDRLIHSGCDPKLIEEWEDTRAGARRAWMQGDRQRGRLFRAAVSLVDDAARSLRPEAETLDLFDREVMSKQSRPLTGHNA